MWAERKLPTDSKRDGGNKFVGTPRLPKPFMGIDGSLGTNLTCQYCEDTSQELDNCKWLQHKLTHECAATQSIVTEESLNTNHH